ncbi:hypothetical protein PVK06_027867 [Gossypium arboreum]|uniref:Reverse transcriptase n=1 Tax=Gossypium arboreum TaxID=29729 RepID=A0ABR0P1X6_GOSAR|nr:hypothetical protein PVK06_027867 [Gossypium arboreum]
MKADNFIRKSGFDNSLKVEAKGFYGGIWILWRKELDVNIIQASNQFIHTICKSDYHNFSCYATMIYASRNPKKRVVVWNQLLSIALPEPWVLGGNLNAIVSTDEQRGGARNGSLGNAPFKGFSAMRGCFHPLEALAFQKLSVEVTDDEIKMAMFGMHPQKSLGIDRIHVMFYQKNWEVVGRSICSFVHAAFLDGNIADWVNCTVIVLIPKVEKQERI